MSKRREWRVPMDRALREIEAGSLDGDTFLRSMMHHPTWLVPGRSEGARSSLGVIQTSKGRILEVYSDERALEQLELSGDAEFTGEILRMEGYALFSSLDGMGVDRLNINPGAEPKLSWRGEQLELLVAWGRQAEVELALLEPERVHDPFGALAHYEGYWLIHELNEDAHSIVLAPDAHGRALGAVFTSWDCAEEFRALMQEESAGVLEATPIAGRELFPLMKRMAVQGVVFNPWTLIPARALQSAVLDELLARLDH